MASRDQFEIEFAPETIEHVRVIEPKYHRLIRQAADQQLRFNPGEETRNRKLLEEPAPLDATWELRFGPGNRFRIFYAIDAANHVVQILGVGVKQGNRLLIGGEEFEL